MCGDMDVGRGEGGGVGGLGYGVDVVKLLGGSDLVWEQRTRG